MNRRNVLKAAALATSSALLPTVAFTKEKKKQDSKFKFSLNTSTISGQKLGVKKYIEIAAQAGYDCVELWVGDVKEYKDQGGSLATLKKLIDDSKVTVPNAIGFALWMSNDDAERKQAFVQMRDEMEMMAALGCARIAAPSMGMSDRSSFDLFKIGERYRALIELGRSTGVKPQLEFWGASPTFYHIGQALMTSTIANEADVRILADVYHLFRGGSGFENLKMINGDLIEIFHMNDYPGTIPREMQQDKHRVYPGDGVAPLQQILRDLKNMGGTKILSLELFNEEYWKQDALLVAKTGLDKMRKQVDLAN